MFQKCQVWAGFVFQNEYWRIWPVAGTNLGDSGVVICFCNFSGDLARQIDSLYRHWRTYRLQQAGNDCDYSVHGKMVAGGREGGQWAKWQSGVVSRGGEFCVTAECVFHLTGITPIPSASSGQAQSSPVKGEEGNCVAGHCVTASLGRECLGLRGLVSFDRLRMSGRGVPSPQPSPRTGEGEEGGRATTRVAPTERGVTPISIFPRQGGRWGKSWAVMGGSRALRIESGFLGLRPSTGSG